MVFTDNPPLSLYVHLPWCERKCPYCDFNSHQADGFDEQAYIKSLIEDLQQDLPLIWGRQIVSIFIGGGTPSLFSTEAIQQLLSGLRSLLNFNPGIEITMEANPGSADESRFRGYREAGINRLSIGVQSFDDASLQAIGRIHNGSQSIAAFNKARQAGFENINLDLMYALPGQTLQQLHADLSRAIECRPEHISLYQLTIEPNTLFHSRTPDRLPDDDLSWDMLHKAQQSLASAGFEQYEISAYATKDRQSQHNVNYWCFGDYLGIGAGAHEKITLPAEGRVIRRTRTRHPETYMQHQGFEKISEERELDEQDLVFEFMLNALRLVNGFDKTLFTQRSGLSSQLLNPAIQQAVKLKLLTDSKNWLQPTSLGLQFHNDLQALFLDVDTSQKLVIEPKIHF
ncbi:MAG: oxygen-independent coproporphyrinogen III oxidase-like protein [Gammaproteobacteria bacterium]|nr:oxygen-independent coproporphyrinogen III oxidase-like protein [Gammaproteobacteria bacterium]